MDLIPIIIGLVGIVRLYFILSWARDRRNASRARRRRGPSPKPPTPWGFAQSDGRWPTDNELANILRARGYKA